MNYCKTLALKTNGRKWWVEYEHKTTTTRYEVDGLKSGACMMSAFMSGVDEWVGGEDV